MKKLLLLSAVVLASCGSNQNTGATAEVKAAPKPVADPVPYASTITAADLSKHLYIYASDEFEGRETGQPGQKKAIEYIKNYYVSQGIPAAKGNNDYFQPVPLEMAASPKGSIAINGKAYTIGEDYATFAGKNEGTINYDEVVYMGYGIVDDKYSDYDGGTDIEGKVVLVKAGEPKNADGTYVITGTGETSKWSNIRQALGEKIQIAQDKKAKGILFFDEGNFPLILQQFQFIKNMAEGGGGQMSVKGKEESFFYYFINADMAKALHTGINDSAESKTLKTNMDITTSSESKKVDSENVVAYIKGTEKPNEYLVISSHLDHIGVTDDGQINNGADDDGSGTVSMLEIAEAFQKAAKDGNGPKRSVVFLHVTGEEKGLLGSDYYTQEPIFPLEDTVANLNIDMVGRTDPDRSGDPNYVYLIGSDKLSTELHNLSEEINAKYANLELDYKFNDENDPNRFYYRSDHYNFAKNNIPIIFYFNGTHADYHRPSDTPDKIEYDLMANRAKLIFHTAWELANRAERVKVDKATE